MAFGLPVGRGGEERIEGGGGASRDDGGQIALEMGLFDERRQQIP